MRRKFHKPYEKLKTVLRENNITYAEIAKELGVSESSVSEKINGVSDFYLSEVDILLEKYGIHMEVFLT